MAESLMKNRLKENPEKKLSFKDALLSLKQSNDRFLKIYLCSPAAMGISTIKEGRFIDVNNRYLKFFGYTREEVIGRTSNDLNIWVDRNKRTKAIQHMLKYGTVQNWEGKFRLKSGVIKELIFSMDQINFLDEKKSCILFMFQDISELKNAQEALKISQKILKEQKIVLEQKNSALKEIISYIEVEKDKTKEYIVSNIDLVMPLFEKLKIKGNSHYMLDLIKKGLEDLSSTFGCKISQGSLKLTSREIEICNMIKAGLATKEIAQALSITSQTIEKHRKNIRKKMGISNTSANLVTHLKTI